ncbi:MAG: translocation/assembly module TamB, partial [Bacteroidetes bacterium QH_1_61_8]
STLRQFGQDFNITEGTVTFNGDPETPEISIVAVYEKRAQGSQGNEVRITLKLTGRPANELLSGGEGGNGGGMATQMALGQASDFVENLAASELGLDVVRVQIRPSGLSYLTIGRYFTPRLFASIQQPVTTSAASTTQKNNQYAPDLTLEYQLFDTLLLRALNNQQSLQLNLLFEYAY